MKKFTVIDALIVFALAAVLAAAVFVMKPKFSANTGDDKAIFTVLISKAEKGSSDAIKIGDEVSLSFSEKAYGTVTQISEEPYKETVLNSLTGKYNEQEISKESDIKITVECPADVSDTSIKNGELEIKVGYSMPIIAKGYTFQGTVIELEDEKGGNDNVN